MPKCVVITAWVLLLTSVATGACWAAAAAQVCKPSEYAADTYFPKPAFLGQTRAPASSSHVSYKVETVASGLAHPWSLAFLPDRRMLVTEKTGRLRIVSRSGVL